MKISVVYALPLEQFLCHVDVQEGACVKDAIVASGLLRKFPDLLSASVGIFGKEVLMDTLLKENDRVEIYRGLLMDPKEARKKRMPSP